MQAAKDPAGAQLVRIVVFLLVTTRYSIFATYYVRVSWVGWGASPGRRSCHSSVRSPLRADRRVAWMFATLRMRTLAEPVRGLGPLFVRCPPNCLMAGS